MYPAVDLSCDLFIVRFIYRVAYLSHSLVTVRLICRAVYSPCDFRIVGFRFYLSYSLFIARLFYCTIYLSCG